MKPIPLEALERLLGPTLMKKPTTSSKKSSEATSPATSTIVDITDQYTGKSVMIAGAKKPE
jgi:hypothetical protein